MGFRRGFARLTRWLVIPAVVAGLLTQAAPQARAEDPHAEVQKQQDKLKYIQQQKAAAQNEFQRANWEAEEAAAQLEQADKDLAQADAQYTVITNQKVAAEAALQKVSAQLKDAEALYAQRKQLLAARVRAINESGRVSYLEVLFGSHSFGDFINRFDMLRSVVSQDSKLFAQVRADKVALEQKRLEAQTKADQLAMLKAQADARKAEADQRRAQQLAVSRSLDTRKRVLLDQLNQLEAQEQAINDEIWAIQQRANRKGGAFQPIRPVKNAVITDVFGPRMHPILGVQKWHYGTDFAVPAGTPVVAIEDGVVIRASWDDAYGNLIVIDHGNGISSWYGHNSAFTVSVGQEVKQGQQIAKAGSTGWSTGPHCHLEIHVNGKAVDPMSYLQ